MAYKYLPFYETQAFCVKVFQGYGFSEEDSRRITEVLLEADLSGIESHGIQRLTRYDFEIRSGFVKIGSEPEIVYETPISAVMDGHDGMGQIIGVKAMEFAIRKASLAGIGIVTVRDSNHYGIAGYYADMAAKKRLIGISMTNSESIMVPTYGKEPVLGTNPIAFAMYAEPAPFCFDAATTVVPRGKLEVYAKRGSGLPDGWAIDETGRPSSDSDRVLKNIINKSCFTNCCKLEELYVSDLVTYIGEWAFAYCTYLKNISVKEGTLIDNNALSNCPAKIHYRKEASNYLFESDNLYTLTSMQKAYKGKVDSILIDPPYNSHIDYIGYKDGDYSEGYYNFMSQRIALSYELLSEKGFLVINIDEGEVQGLTDLCKKYFAQNLVQVCKWKKLHPYFDINRDVKPGKKVVECEFIIVCRKSDKAVLKDIMQPYIHAGSLKEKVSPFPEVFDCFGTTSSAKDEICQIFGRRDYFSTPKPVKLMKELIRATSSSDSIIMDFFAGSGTTGHACFELNSEDGGKRKVIMICNNESNICQEVTRKRMDYAAQKCNASFVFMN